MKDRAMHRRTILRATALAPVAAGLAACTATTSGGITTATINVAQVNSYGQAVLNAVALLTSAPGVSALIGPYASVITLAVTMAKADLQAFDTAAGGSLTVSFSTTSVSAAVQSLLTDAQTVFGDFQTAIGSQLGALGGAVTTYYNAFTTVVSLIQAVVSTAQGLASAPVTPMTEAQALAALGVKPAS
jgi:hypothetical protein